VIFLKKYDLIIIGSGIAGMTSAIYAARYGLKTLVLTENVGGLLNDAYPVENFPGFKSISGFELMKKIKEQVEGLGIEIKSEEVSDILTGKNFIVVGKNRYECTAVILATGSKRKKLGVKGEKEFSGKGVHYCAICDAMLYKNKVVAVVGGSESAAQAALLLSEYAKKVYIIYRREKLRAEKIYLDKIKKNNKIEIISNTNIIEIRGKDKVESVIFDNPYKGSNEFKTDAVFIEVGSEPSTELAKKIGVNLNENNEIIVNEKMETNVRGIFAAGDVTNSVLKQAVVAAGSGAVAAFSAYKYIQSEE